MRPAKRARRLTRNRKADPVKELLPELIEKIFSHLSLRDLMSCSAVSRDWYHATSTDYLWRPLCKLQGWSNDCGKFRKCIDCFENFDRDVQHINGFFEWKKHYVLKNQIKKNWFKGNYQKYKIPLTLNEISSITCVTSSNTLLAYGCSNGELKVFEIKDKYRLIQTIQCKEDAAITTIRISTKYLIFTQNLLLFIFKSRKGCYKFCSIKSMSSTEVEDINDPSLHLGENLEKTLSEHTSGTEFPVFKENALFGVKFVLVDDSLIAATSASQLIHIWNLRTTNARKCQLFELDDDTEVGDICVANNVLYLSIILKKRNTNEISSHPMAWLIQAFSMRNYRELYRSEVHRYDEVAIPALEANDAYVAVSFRPGHVFLFDRHDGSLIFHERTVLFLDARSENSDFVGVKYEDTLIIYNPKTKRTVASVDLQGAPWGIYHDVLITVSTGFDRFGRGIPYMEFWWLKKKKYLSYGPILVLTFRSLSNVVFLDETKIVLFVENKYLYIFSFMA